MRRDVARRMAVTAGAFVAAGVAASVVNDKRRDRRRLRRGEDVEFGTVHSPAFTITGHDGTAINVEVDEPPGGADLTVVFLHGWMCTLDTWHYQRLALRGTPGLRMVFMDHRGHGGSGRSRAAGSTLADLAKDVAIVLQRVVPEGPLVLVGHSMGGMTIQRLAIDEPSLFGDRVQGVALVGTSSGRLLQSSPAVTALVPLLRVIRPAMDWGRSFNSYSVLRRWAVGPEAEPKHIDMCDEMILRARSNVIFDFHRNFVGLDLTPGHETLGRARTVVVGGPYDQLTPYSHSERLADGIPGARLVTVEGAGHMMMFEQHETVTEAIEELIDQVRSHR